jgi:hypothetical protein
MRVTRAKRSRVEKTMMVEETMMVEKALDRVFLKSLVDQDSALEW